MHPSPLSCGALVKLSTTSDLSVVVPDLLMVPWPEAVVVRHVAPPNRLLSPPGESHIPQVGSQHQGLTSSL